MPKLIVLDFDGVVADSEMLANTLLADSLTRFGKPTTLDDSIRLFMGKRWEDTHRAIETWIGGPVPEAFVEAHRARSKAVMRRDVGPVVGAADFLHAHAHIPRCVASSSSIEWLDHCVDKFGFRSHLGRNLFSATEVSNGKPAPDIFLLAADRMGVSPRDCVVVEDSPSGVIGARAAGMTVVGFLGASHIRDGHGERLREAGAHHLAHNFGTISRLIAEFG
ncbi:MAG: HAD family hydrolase [Hyphomicrobiaceae bacterium]